MFIIIKPLNSKYTFNFNKRQEVFMLNRELFSYRLKQLRTEKKLSMQALAQAVGLKNKGSIGQFETSLNIPSAETLVALADYFNVSLDYLVGRSDTPDRK